jgi:hypothetical protein
MHFRYRLGAILEDRFHVGVQTEHPCRRSTRLGVLAGLFRPLVFPDELPYSEISFES